MWTRYKFIDNETVYFTTSTVAGWTDIFTREYTKQSCWIVSGIVSKARV